MRLKMWMFIRYNSLLASLIFVTVTYVTQVYAATTITKTEGPGEIIVKDGIKELRVMLGDTIALTCTVDGDAGTMTSLWFGPLFGLSYNDNLLHPDTERFSIISQRTADDTATEFTVRIQNLTSIEEGNYRCQGIAGQTDNVQLFVASNAATTITKTEGPGDIIVENGGKELTLMGGDTIGLTCTVNGEADIVTATWLGPETTISLNNILLYPDSERYSITVQRTADDTATEYILRIQNLMQEDAGNYRCQGILGLTDDVELYVPSNAATTITKTEGPGDINVENGTKELRLMSGDTIALTCTVNGGTDRVSSLWFGPLSSLSMDGNLLNLDERYTITVERTADDTATEYTLRIERLRPEESGNYRCQGIGDLTDEIELFVTSNAATTITKTEGPGEIIVKNDSKELRLKSGDTIALTCTVNGYSDMVSSLWFGPTSGLTFEENLLHPDNNKFSITSQRTADDKATEYILRIQNLEPEDEGNYRCQGIEGLTDEIQLFVSMAANISSITALQFASEGDPVSLECIAEGNPTPQVRWRHVRPNNKLPNGIYGVYIDGINLDITSITLEDRGEYECIVSNGLPDFSSVVTRTTYIQMEYQPIVKAISDHIVEVPAGETTSLTCKCMAHPRPSASEVTWYLNDESLSEEIGYTLEVVYKLETQEIDPYNETTFSVLQIPKVDSSSSGQYKCHFENSRGSDFLVIDVVMEDGVVEDVATTKPISVITEASSVVMETTKEAPKASGTQLNVKHDKPGRRQRSFGRTIGGVLAGVFIIVILIIALILYCRFKKTRQQKGAGYGEVGQTMEPKVIVQQPPELEEREEGDGL